MIKRILILEDHVTVLAKLLEKLGQLEDRQPFQFSLTIINNSEQVESLINNNPRAEFDIILLDRDCKINKSFHILDLEHFGAEKVIAISAIQEWNKQAQDRGVTKVIEKNLFHIDKFIDEVIKTIEEYLSKKPWN